MAARRTSSSSDDILSDESDSNVVNLYDSDVENLVERFEESGPRPYQFEPRRVRREDVEQEESAEQDDSDADRLGNTDWYLICFAMYLNFS